MRILAQTHILSQDHSHQSLVDQLDLILDKAENLDLDWDKGEILDLDAVTPFL